MKKQILEQIVEGYIPTMDEALMMMESDCIPLNELICAANMVTKSIATVK